MDERGQGLTIEDVLLVLGLRKSMGELVIESGNNIGSVLFHEGKILHALSPYSRAIGDLLVEDGVLTEQELIEMLRLQKTEQQVPLGSLVMRAGKISLEVVEMLVHAQIRDAITTFRSWDNISVSFVSKEVRPFDSIHLPVYEFIGRDQLRAALAGLEQMLKRKDNSLSAPAR